MPGPGVGEGPPQNPGVYERVVPEADFPFYEGVAAAFGPGSF